VHVEYFVGAVCVLILQLFCCGSVNSGVYVNIHRFSTGFSSNDEYGNMHNKLNVRP